MGPPKTKARGRRASRETGKTTPAKYRPPTASGQGEFVVYCVKSSGLETPFQRYETEAEASIVAARLNEVSAGTLLARVEHAP